MCMCACIAVGTLCLQGVATELHMLLRASGVALVGRPSEIELTHINLPQDAKVCVFFSMVFFHGELVLQMAAGGAFCLQSCGSPEGQVDKIFPISD